MPAAKKYLCLNCDKNLAVKFCSSQCQSDHQYKAYILDWQQGARTGGRGSDGSTVSGHVRKYLMDKFNRSCCNCNLDTWQEQPITLEIDHKDGNPLNHAEDNLRLLCPNCHSQTSTYKAKNMGNGRHSRRQRYQEGKSF